MKIKTIFSMCFLAIVLFWALNACNPIEAPKEVTPRDSTSVDSGLVITSIDTVQLTIKDTLKIE